MADAGRIVIIPKGEYKSNVTYERLDAVEYNNNGYIALKTVTGITPTNDGTNWALYVKGTQVDTSLSATSSNPIANKAVNEAVNNIENTLATNGYGENAGGKNLLDVTASNYYKLKYNIEKVLQKDGSLKVTNKDNVAIPGIKFVLTSKLPKGTYTVSSLSSSALYIMTTSNEYIPISNSLTFDYDGSSYLQLVGANISSGSSVTYKIQLEQGSEATAYEPYFPSNKMLMEENRQQSTEMLDIKMLGWSVPRECPIQNEVSSNQFIQKVGRVDLGSLEWSYETDNNTNSFLTRDISKSIKIIDVKIDFNGFLRNYSRVSYYYMYNNVDFDKCVCVGGTGNISIRNLSYTDTTAFKTAMQGQYLYYELATPITKNIDSNEIGETVSDVRKETTVNLLNPTLQTTTKNGVTCTNNGDGTYTLNGTASANAYFDIASGITLSGVYKFICFKRATNDIYAYLGAREPHYLNDVYKSKATINCKNEPFVVYIKLGSSISNVTIKPMLTTNLNATYDDFVPYTGDTGSLNGDVADIRKEVSQTATHNMPRIVPKDITSYITDGTFYKRLNGTDGFDLFEDIYIGDYIKMSRPITCPNQNSSAATTGSQYVTIIGLDTLQGNGDNIAMNYHHAVMTAGQGFSGAQHFGRHRMNSTGTTAGGYVGSEMNTSVLGAVTSSGSTASDATINQQLYAEFGSHLKTTRELCSNSINASGYNRFGSNTGCSNNWVWGSYQAILMSEVEVYGSTVWSSSGYDTGSAKMQMPLFTHNRQAMNNRSSWYWLKDVASGTDFCDCGNNGNAGYDGASNVWGCVRPRFVIGA